MAANSIRPPFKSPLAEHATRTGRHPSWFRHSMSRPLARRASISGPLGRCCIRAFPVSTTWCWSASGFTRHATDVRNRAAVPALPRYKCSAVARRSPPCPVTAIVSPLSCHSTSAPCNAWIACNMYLVSSEWSKFLILHWPSPKAASTRARLETDFEPGGTTVNSRGCVSNGYTFASRPTINRKSSSVTNVAWFS